jgi:hypothetical protein
LKNRASDFHDHADLEKSIEPLCNPVNKGVNTIRAEAVNEEVSNCAEDSENAPRSEHGKGAKAPPQAHHGYQGGVKDRSRRPEHGIQEGELHCNSYPGQYLSVHSPRKDKNEVITLIVVTISPFGGGFVPPGAEAKAEPVEAARRAAERARVRIVRDMVEAPERGCAPRRVTKVQQSRIGELLEGYR